MKNLLIFILFLFFVSPSIARANTTVNTFQITSDGSQQTQPSIYKNLVAYTNHGGTQGIDIWGYNLEGNNNFPLLEKPGDQFLTGFYENLLVYEDVDSSQNSDVRVYNIKTNQDKLIAGGSGAQTSGVTNSRIVAYIDGGACGNLHVFNLESQTDNIIFSNTCYPIRISKNILVFPAPDPNGTNVKGYNLVNGQLFDISTSNHFQESANIYGNKVVWVHYITGAYGDYNAIVMKDIVTGEEKIIYESSVNSLQSPAVSDKYVVWSQSSAQHVGGVMGADLITGEVFEVQTQGPHQNSHTMPSLWENTAVWQAWRTGNGDIYGSTFQTPPPMVQLTQPSDGSLIQPNSVVVMLADASSSVGVNRVVFHVNGVHQCTDYFAPYECKWRVPATEGIDYTLAAWVIDKTGIRNVHKINVTAQSTPQILFEDNFDGPNLDTNLWEVFNNGGVYNFINGFIEVPGGSALPFFRARNNPFPVSGPFEVEFGIQYLTQAGGGDGVGISFVQQANISDANMWPNNPLAIWQDPVGFRIVSHGSNAFTIAASDFQYHVVKIIYDGQKYNVLLDGNSIYTSPLMGVVGGLWYGHPFYCCPTNGQWTGFKLDYIKVTQL